MRRSLTIGGDHGLALRLRIRHLLDSATLDPQGIAPSAILLVRRLADPLPRRLMPHPDAIVPGSEWERAAQASLDRCARRAVRPMMEFVPGSAEAVLFADPGEMLACLARDLLNGNANMLWWWRAILRALPPGAVEALLAAWRREPRYVPAAIAHLTAQQEALRVLSAISPLDASTVLADVAREFEVTLSAESQATMFDFGSAPQVLAEPKNELGHRWASASGTSAALRVPPPWVPAIPADLVPESLGRERSALLGISLLLHRAPELARSARFSAAFTAWYAAFDQGAEQGAVASLESRSAGATHDRQLPPFGKDSRPPGERDSSVRPVAPEELVPAASRKVDRSNSSASTRRATPPNGQPPVEMEHSLRVPPMTRDLHHDDARSAHASLPPLRSDVSMQPPRAAVMPFLSHSHPDVRTPQPPARETSGPEAVLLALPVVSIAPGEAIQTELGGVLFLINFLCALKLPGSLEAEFGIEPPMNGWTLLELLARCLLGPRYRHLAADPIWTVLAALSGRPLEVPPGNDVRGQKCYRLPQTWLSTFGPTESSSLAVRLRGLHLQLWHECGFVVLDRKFDEAPRHSMIDAAVQSCAPAEHRAACTSRRKLVRAPRWNGCRPLDVDLNPELQRFLAFLLPYVRWRVAVGLGLVDSHPSRLAQELLLHAGRIYVTSTHVDLVMSLNEASSSVRLSGLDADPGWVPDLGRVVKFSFV